MTCTVCHNLKPDTLEEAQPGQTAIHWIDPHILAKSAIAGSCEECSLLARATEIWYPGWISDTSGWTSFRLDVAVGQPVQLKFCAAGSDSRVDLQIYQDPARQDVAFDMIGPAPSVPQFSNSPESKAQIRAWNRECRESHELCKPRAQGFLPTRLLQIQGEEIQLIETRGSPYVPYVALSYCWGDPQRNVVLKTLQGNYGSHQSGILIKTLPAALMDAIELTKELRYDHIWIDALCIVQDDGQDWLREAGTMCRVYSEAAMTIVSGRSNGTSAGMFGEQKYHKNWTIPYRSGTVAVRTNISRDHELHIITPAGGDTDPITKRAWTLQEAILSNRAIHITSDALRWECNTRQYCQCHKVSTKLPLKQQPDNFMYESYRTWRLDEFFPADSLEDAYFMWHTMVTFFSKRQLTNESDRLVAIGGLATRFAQILERNFCIRDRYVAGLWQNHLVQDLLWYVEPKKFSLANGIKHCRPQQWRAPSWSWASMEAPVNFYWMQALSSRIEIIKAEVGTATDPYGSVSSASLCLKAPVLSNVRFVLDPSQVETSRYRCVQYQSLELNIVTTFFDDDEGQKTDNYLASLDPQPSLIIVGYMKSNYTHEALVVIPVFGRPQHFQRIARVRLGQHLFEPEENTIAIENGQVQELVLL